MLSFTPITNETADELIEYITKQLPEADGEYVEEIICSFLDDEECECAAAPSCGCLALRVFEDGYSFIFPVAVCDEADPIRVIDQIREYSIKEEIPLVFTDVPSEALGDLLPIFRHANIDAADFEAETYTVRIISEAQALDSLPTIRVDDEITLAPMSEIDDAAYATLCRDKDTNAFWGFDDLADCDSPEDKYFREVAEGEFSRGVAISLAIRYKGRFAGEATLYHFDYLGDCQCAIRVLPEMRNRAIASRTLGALLRFGEGIGLTSLSSTVMAENKASIALCKKHLDEIVSEEEICRFSKRFDN